MNFVLNATLILLVFFGNFIEDIYLLKVPPEIGNISYITLRSKIPFDFDQEKSFGTTRNIALAKYIPLYTYDPKSLTISKNKMQDIIEKIEFLKKGKDIIASGDEFKKYLKKVSGLDIKAETALTILQYENITNLLRAILEIEETIIQKKIVPDQVPLKDKKAVEIVFNKSIGTVIYPRVELLTFDEARITLSNKISQVFWQVDKNILDPVIELSISTLLPNLKYDHKENDRRIDEIIRRFPSKIISYQPGDVLVSFRKVITEEDVLLLSSYNTNMIKYHYTKLPLVISAIVILMISYNLLFSKVFQPLYGNRMQSKIMLSILIISIIVLKSYTLFTTLFIYSIPIAIIPIIAILLRVERIPTTLMAVTGALLISFLSGPDYRFIFFCCTAIIVTILATPNIKTHSDIILSCLIVAIINVAIFMILFIDWNIGKEVMEAFIKNNVLSVRNIFTTQFLAQMGWVFFGGVVAAPLAFILLPCMSFLWHRASVFQIKNYADLEHPLLKDLLTNAPGTYQHTMMVAHLAQSAGEAVGANSLLIRIGAYYHDIGKILNPKMFIENQFGIKNPHDELLPLQSTKIIMDHVFHGKKIGEEAHLPKIILDFISQHHGTQLMEYFYEKAGTVSEGNPVKEEDFRYPGSKPQSVEVAIMMIADAVEAASRTLIEPSPEKIDFLVRLIIEKRFNDGQFDECNLSTRNLAKIRAAFIHAITASLHNRIEYPWQKEANTQGTE